MVILFVATVGAQALPNQSRPTAFIENRGQITDQFGQVRKDIDFKLTDGEVLVFGGNAQLHYQWNSPAYPKDGKSSVSSYRLDVVLAGANRHAEILRTEMQDDYDIFYLPQCPNGTIAHHYQKITYKNIYPKIDWVLYTNAQTGGLKYDFVVHEGGNPADIRLQYNGATALELNKGSLFITTPFGQIIEGAPYTYDNQTHKEISSGYILNGNELSYDVRKDKAKQKADIIIDPSVNWITYFGAADTEICGSVAVDIAGNAYIAGSTTSTSNIATSGPFQTSHNGGIWDGMLVKFNEAGQRVWACYYGGAGLDKFYNIACDSAGDLYVCGITQSNGLATSGAAQTSYAGARDCIIAKFNNSGQRQWSTYYGGVGNDDAVAIAADNNGGIVIGCNTVSGGLSSAGAYQAGFAGSTTLIAKFSGVNGSLSWATYYGSILVDYQEKITTIATDKANNILLAGIQSNVTSGDPALVSVGAHQTSAGGSGSSDGFIAKFSAAGSRLWGTYYGGSNVDGVYSICIDDSNNVYFGGYTASPNNIASPGAYKTSLSTIVTGGSLFIAKMNSNGIRQWGTYYTDGAAGPGVQSLNIGRTGNLYVYGSGAGSGTSSAGAYKSAMSGLTDMFFSVFNTGGYPLYGSFLGGNAAEYVGYDNVLGIFKNGGLACSYSGRIYMAATTTSSSSLATSNAWQGTYGGKNDIFLASFAMDTLAYLPLPFNDTLFCAGDSVHIPYGVSTNFNTSNNFQLQLSDASGSFATPTTIASVNSDTAGIFHGFIPYNTPGLSGYRMRIVSTSPVRISLRDTMPIRIKPVATAFSASSNTPICAGDTLRLYGASTTPGLIWSWSGPASFTSISKDTIIANAQSNRAGDYVLTATLNGCAIRDTETITVKPLPAKPNTGSNTPLCVGNNLNLTATTITSGVSWNWTGPTSFSSTSQNPTRTGITTADAGNYIVSAILNGCSTKDTETVVINPIPAAPTAGSNSPLCTGNTLSLTASPVAGASYNWTGPASFSSAIQNPSRANVQLSYVGIYSVTATVNGCTSPAGTTNVAISSGPSVSIYVNPNDTICTGGTATFVAIPTNGGTTPQYKWYRNSNFTGVVTASYPVTAPANGDVFYCELTNNTTCALPASSNSNSVMLTVLPNVTPSVTVTANPAGPAPPFQLISFTATPVNGGSSPQYQWTRNGTNVTGATAATWGATTLSNHDTVCVWLTSSEQCPNPKTVKSSNCITVDILTGIEEISDKNALSLFPNPNNGTFTISANGLFDGKAELQIINSLGQLVGQWNKNIVNGEIFETITMQGLRAGIYLFKIRSKESIRTLKFTVYEL